MKLMQKLPNKFSTIMNNSLAIPTKWILFMIATVGIIAPATSQILNTPPVMYVDRNWRISETEEIGSIIARVRASDAENDNLQFGLEPLYHGNYGSTNNNEGTTNDKLPFRIDSHSGIVYLNESLQGRGGENFFLYITVYDGQLTAKNEVFVNILSKKNNKNIYKQNQPILPQQSSSLPTSQLQPNISQFFPPFYSLPGVQSIRNQPNNPRQTLDIFNGSQPPTRSHDLIPGFNNLPATQRINPPSSSITDVSDTDTDENIEDDNAAENNENMNGGGGSGGRVGWPSRTKLTPINENDGNSGTKVNNKKISPKSNNSSKISEKDKIISKGASSDDSNAAGINSSNNKNENNQDFTAIVTFKAFIPVLITICGIFLAAILIGIVVYRKRLCAISKTLKKKSKEEMAKKSNQSNLSSNITDDSRNSMVLQHWNGPMAFNNRYVPWERDNQQLSIATSQLSTSCITGEIGNGTIPATTNGENCLIGNGGGGDGGNSQLRTDRWEFPRHRLKFFNILGEGAFGQVWRCEATDIDGNDGITTVAVKTLKENASEVERNDLQSELQVMKSLEPHVNVVRFLGCCTDKDPIFVIIEYVNRGKLQTYLRNSRAERHYGNTHGKSNILTSGDLTSFMYQVAKGMDYLTSRGIIHRDLAARNILITDDHTCKIADFGFARDVITSKIYERKSEGKLPIRWMATESLYDNIFSVKSDIWSFGILMWEIVTLGSTPYPGISAADVMRKVRDGYRLEKPEHCRRELYNIMFYCWANDSSERPTFSEIVIMLDKLLHTEMDYIELERFPDHNYYNILNLSGEKL